MMAVGIAAVGAEGVVYLVLIHYRSVDNALVH